MEELGIEVLIFILTDVVSGVHKMKKKTLVTIKNIQNSKHSFSNKTNKFPCRIIFFYSTKQKSSQFKGSM